MDAPLSGVHSDTLLSMQLDDTQDNTQYQDTQETTPEYAQTDLYSAPQVETSTQVTPPRNKSLLPSQLLVCHSKT